MAGSQLTQLKTALTSAGLNRKTHSKKDKKTFKKGGARETDRGKTLAKLEDIRRNLNKFDERETRVKHDVGGRNLKGVIGRPSASKQAGLEQRRKTLLPEHQLRGHTGTFRDRRFGESDPSMTLEDRMLERYTRERQRGQGKKGLFNLEDEEDGLDGFDEGTALGGLTHGGRSVTDLPGDDFEIQGLGGDEDDEDDRAGRIARRVVGRAHFGGFDGDEEEEEDLSERKKSKAEVMSEIIAKSKMHKVERQQQKDQDEDLRDALDEDIDVLRELLEGAPKPQAPPAASLPGPSRQPAATNGGAEDADYDQIVRSLAYEARAKPKDRTKTEEELAVEEAETLQRAEAKRLRRMRGEDVSDEEDEEGGGYRKRRRTERRGDADDLDDDFEDDEDDLLGPGITREQLERMGAAGRKVEDGDSVDEDEESDEEEEDEDEDDEEDEEEEDDEDDEEDENLSAMEDLDDEAPELAPVDEEEFPVVHRSKGKERAKAGRSKEIPFTFPCPSSIEEFEEIMDELDDSALPIVVQRIRAIHHPSLAQGNKEKLQDFLGVLLDYILILASRPSPAFELISSITSHLIALVKLNPLTASSHFISKIVLMQKNLARGLARGAASSDSKTFPGGPELVFLRLVGSIWSTSDYSHPVVIPAVLLIGQYLSQSRVRSITDLASGLFLCSILSQYEALSKRLLPEAINFIGSSLLTLLPRRKDAKPSTTFPDLKVTDLDLSLTSSSKSPQEPIDLGVALRGDEEEQTRVDLVAVALRLVQIYSTLYASSEAFSEMFSPVLNILEGSRVSKLSQSSKDIHTSVQTTLAQMLKFARQSRQPLAIQSHKPVPIRTFAPRFEDDFAPGRHYDPDVERNSTAKAKALYKKERKGAIRELRKDNKFLAGEKAREQSEKDREYNSKMKRVEGQINLERAEEKEMIREKQREKRRSGRK